MSGSGKRRNTGGGKSPARSKIFSKKFEKSVDNRHDLCYNDYSKREEEPKMMNWYMNPELHDEDYEELLELLVEEEGEG